MDWHFSNLPGIIAALSTDLHLLSLRMEDDVLGVALEGVEMEEDSKSSELIEDPENVDEKEKLEIKNAVAGALKDNFEKFDKIARAHNIAHMEAEDAGVHAMETESSSADPEEEDAEGTSNLQLSWEMLELAKMVFTKKSGVSEGEKKAVADAKACEALQVMFCIACSVCSGLE